MRRLSTPYGRMSSLSAHQFWALGGTVGLCIALVAAVLLLDGHGQHATLAATIILAAIASALSCQRAWRADRAIRREFAETTRRYVEVYDKAGVSIWREDWSEVGKAITRLREAGVSNIPAWFAERPEEADALHARVTITGVNRKSVELMRAASESDLLGTLADVIPGSAAAFGRWMAALDRGDPMYLGESVIQRLDGEPFDCLVTAALPAPSERLDEIIVSIVEITDYKRDQASLARARDEIARTQRVATVGALTASIAHEVNSPLAAIASNAAACLRWLEREEPEIEEAREAATAVIMEAERIKAIIDRTRSYLQRAERITEDRDLRTLIQSALRIVEGEAHAHEINISLDLSHDLGVVTCEPVQLQQALVNLMVNAIQAMSDTETRHLTVRAERREGYRRISIEDTGGGIAAADLRRIFEPFYSTKEGGMGMGLSICRTIVEAHGGTLAVNSREGVGTRFLVSLPEGTR
jgi:signal transduction histidine kinase